MLVKLVAQGVNGLVEYNNSTLSAVLQGGLSNQSFKELITLHTNQIIQYLILRMLVVVM